MRAAKAPPAELPAQNGELIFATGTAGEHLCRSFPVAREEESARAVRASLLGRQFEAVDDIVVCDGPRVNGLVPIERLLAAPDLATMGDLMDIDVPLVHAGEDRERAAWKAVRHHERSLVVVDDDGTLLGLVPARRLLTVLLVEHDEDMARLGGFLRATSVARIAGEEPVARRFWHRLPWLLIGLLGALAATDLVALFEDELRREVSLAFFVPGIVYMADAVGTQTETIVIRGLSVGVPVSRILRRELLTGVLVGIVISLAFLPFGLWRWGEADVVATVAIALLAACSTATIVAVALPWALSRTGADPAFGSGPLATVVQDLLSILIFFLVASELAL